MPSKENATVETGDISSGQSNTSRPGTYGSRKNNVNLLRFIAAAMVIYYHVGGGLGKSDSLIMGQEIGYIAVNIFFLLSGYLIAASWTHSSSFPSYLIRRIARIFPALAVVVMATTFVIGSLFTTLSCTEYFANGETWKYLSLVFLAPIENVLPGVFEDLPRRGVVNASLWTLRYEFLMYLLVPVVYCLLGKLGNRLRKPVSLGLLVFLAVGHSLIAGGTLHAPEALDKGFRLATYFFVGACIYDHDLVRRFNPQYSVLALLFVVVFSRETGSVCPALMLVALTVFVFGFSFAAQPKFAKCFSENDFSYGLYIWAYPVQQVLISLTGGSSQDPTIVYSLAVFAVTFALATLSWFVVEKPCIALGKKLSKRFSVNRSKIKSTR